MSPTYITSYLPLLAVLIPTLGLAVVALNRDTRATLCVSIVAFADLVTILSMYPAIHHGQTLQIVINTGLQLKLHFMADPLSILTGLIGITVWTLASFYGIEYFNQGHALKRYSFFSLLSLIGMMGVVFTGNLFSLYIFFELLSVASYVMVIHEETPEAKRAGFVYLFMGVIGGLILLFGVVASYSIAGTGDIYQMADKLRNHPLLPYIFWCYIIGFGVKAGLFPVHVWLPLAHPVAPAPASALLSGIMIKAGAYGIFRTIYAILGISVLKGHYAIWGLLLLAWVNILLGSAVAISQTEIKKMLAYSSISQIGYIILGAALATPLGIVGGMTHIFNHAIIKVMLFLCAGVFIHQVGLRQLKDLKGIGKRMPITTLCFTLGGLSMIGFPPFNGFISKWFLALGSLELMKVGAYQSVIGITSMVILLLSSLMNLIYYGPIIYNAWFSEPEAAGQTAHTDHGHAAPTGGNSDPNWLMRAPLLILATAIVYFGIFPGLPVDLAQQAAKLFLP